MIMEMWQQGSLRSNLQRVMVGYHQEQLMATIIQIGEDIHALTQNGKRIHGGELIFKQFTMSIKLRLQTEETVVQID